MKKILLIVILLLQHFILKAELNDQPEWRARPGIGHESSSIDKALDLSLLNGLLNEFRYKSCDILFPGQRDIYNRYCLSPGWYAVLYEGVIMNSRCYPNYEAALEVMDRNQVCHMGSPAGYYYCGILNAGEKDMGRRGCMDFNKYGVTYDGYAIDGQCFDTIDEALRKAEYTGVCRHKPPLRIGACTLLQPGKSDRRGSRCSNSNYYNYLRDGYMMKNMCFPTIDQTLTEMKRSRACYTHRD